MRSPKPQPNLTILALVLALKRLKGGQNRVVSGRRFYSPELGRWMNRDSIGEEGGVGTIVFVRNDPESRVDGSGLLDFCESHWDPSGPRVQVIEIRRTAVTMLEQSECFPHGGQAYGHGFRYKRECPGYVSTMPFCRCSSRDRAGNCCSIDRGGTVPATTIPDKRLCGPWKLVWVWGYVPAKCIKEEIAPGGIRG